MPIYIAPYIGSGTRHDPLRPRGSDQPGWDAIRFKRPGQLSVDCKAWLWLPEPDPDPLLVLLGDDKAETLSLLTCSKLDLALGVTCQKNATLRDVLFDLLLNPPANGWNPLKSTLTRGSGGAKARRYEAWLNGERWVDIPAIEGGASASSTFDGTENPLSEGGMWETGVGNWNTLQKGSGRVRIVTMSTDSMARLTTPTIGNDQYSQVTIIVNAGSPSFGPSVRAGTGTDEKCYAAYTQFGSNDNVIVEIDTDFVTTQLGAPAGTATSGAVMRLEVSGTTLTLKKDTATVMSRTDASITSGQPGMVMWQSGGDVTYAEFDDWSGGDLSQGESISVSAGAAALTGRVLDSLIAMSNDAKIVIRRS